MTLAISRRAVHYPDRIALIDHTTDETVSYGELDARATSGAWALAEHDVDAGDAVAVIGNNRIEYLSLLWACRRLDATLAPISFRLPPETVASLVDRIDPALVLVEDDFRDRVSEVDAPVDDLVGIDAPQNDTRPEPQQREAPAMYLHTGGTTGVPKVVPISERQLEWNAITEVAAWGLGKDEVIPLLLPLFHTGGWNLLTLPTLYVGGRVVLQRAFDPGEALAMIDEYHATRAFGVAAIFQAMAEHPDFDDTDLDSLDWAMSGGGPTPSSVMDRFRERGVPFTQGYGLTEGGPNNLYFDPERPDQAKADDSVGRPFPDCEARIVDDAGEAVPAGQIGELELRGPITANKYLATEDGTFDGTWVSTGDLARVDADGDFSIEGRVDNMFVSGGENVYPEAIERALERYEGVAAVGVVPIDHDRWGQVPAAAIQPESGATIDIDDLNAHAEEQLAGYAVPDRFVLVEELPTTGPGKLDRDAIGDLV